MSAGHIEAVFRTVERLTANGKLASTGQIAKALHRAPNTISSSLWHLENMGWLHKVEQHNPRGYRPTLLWKLTAKARNEPYAPGLPYTDTPERVMALIVDDGAWTIRELADRLQRPYETVRRACQRLVKSGELQQTYNHEGCVVLMRPLLDDDGWTPPTNYMTAARAYALGLR